MKFLLLVSIYILIISSIKSEDELKIYISVTEPDFESPLSNKEVYKIITKDERQIRNANSLEILKINTLEELDKKSISYGPFGQYYYIYKQIKPLPKYVGVIGQSEMFKFKNDIPDLDKVFNESDVILPTQMKLKGIYKQFQDCHLKTAIDDCLDIIKNKFPEYQEAAQKAMESNNGYMKNMFIMKKEDFEKFSNFTFGVLMEFDKKHNLNTDEEVKNYIQKEWGNVMDKDMDIEQQKKIQLFLSERIANIFYTHHFKKPCVMQIEKIININEENEKKMKKIENEKKDLTNKISQLNDELENEKKEKERSNKKIKNFELSLDIIYNIVDKLNDKISEKTTQLFIKDLKEQKTDSNKNNEKDIQSTVKLAQKLKVNLNNYLEIEESLQNQKYKILWLTIYSLTFIVIVLISIVGFILFCQKNSENKKFYQNVSGIEVSRQEF